MIHNWYLILALAFMTKGCLADYSNDYNYDEDYEEEEEPQPSLNPQFTIGAQAIKVQSGHTIRLPCLVDRLGPMVISWKKRGPSSNEQQDQWLAIGKILYVSGPDADRFSVEIEPESKGSTLVIALAKPSDVGDYICQVSSNPPATLRHSVTMIVPPQVNIVTFDADDGPALAANASEDRDPENERKELRLRTGDDLVLECQATGDPEPVVTWSRERRKMPDGTDDIQGNEIMFKNVTRKHSGTYVCSGVNGPSQKAAQDKIKVNVLHVPDIITEESYVQVNGSYKLELLCIVNASPKAKVYWYKDGRRLEEATLEERMSITHNGRKHFMTIEQVGGGDKGHYTCHAVNDLGESKGNIQVMGSIDSGLNSNKLFLFEDIPSSIEGSQDTEPLADRAMEALPVSSAPSIKVEILAAVLCFSLIRL